MRTHMKNNIRELSLQEIDAVAGGPTGHYTDGWNQLPDPPTNPPVNPPRPEPPPPPQRPEEPLWPPEDFPDTDPT